LELQKKEEQFEEEAALGALKAGNAASLTAPSFLCFPPLKMTLV
jgi:hypothetical protein